MIDYDYIADAIHERITAAQHLTDYERYTQHDVNVAMDTLRDLAVVMCQKFGDLGGDFDEVRFNQIIKEGM